MDCIVMPFQASRLYHLTLMFLFIQEVYSAEERGEKINIHSIHTNLSLICIFRNSEIHPLQQESLLWSFVSLSQKGMILTVNVHTKTGLKI